MLMRLGAAEQNKSKRKNQSEVVAKIRLQSASKQNKSKRENHSKTVVNAKKNRCKTEIEANPAVGAKSEQNSVGAVRGKTKLPEHLRAKQEQTRKSKRNSCKCKAKSTRNINRSKTSNRSKIVTKVDGNDSKQIRLQTASKQHKSKRENQSETVANAKEIWCKTEIEANPAIGTKS